MNDLKLRWTATATEGRASRRHNTPVVLVEASIWRELLLPGTLGQPRVEPGDFGLGTTKTRTPWCVAGAWSRSASFLLVLAPETQPAPTSLQLRRATYAAKVGKPFHSGVEKAAEGEHRVEATSSSKMTEAEQAAAEPLSGEDRLSKFLRRLYEAVGDDDTAAAFNDAREALEKDAKKFNKEDEKGKGGKGKGKLVKDPVGNFIKRCVGYIDEVLKAKPVIQGVAKAAQLKGVVDAILDAVGAVTSYVVVPAKLYEFIRGTTKRMAGNKAAVDGMLANMEEQWASYELLDQSGGFGKGLTKLAEVILASLGVAAAYSQCCTLENFFSAQELEVLLKESRDKIAAVTLLLDKAIGVKTHLRGEEIYLLVKELCSAEPRSESRWGHLS